MPDCAREECGRWRPGLLVRYARLGLRVDGEWFCSADCVAASTASRLRYAEAQTVAADRTTLRMGSLLVHQGVITADQLKIAARSRVASGLRLGAELTRLGYADAGAVLRALAAQAGVSYLGSVDVASVRSAPGGLCAEEVRALGVVPIRTSDDGVEPAVVVACAAPLPRAALSALTALTGYKTIPYLVSDEDFEALAAAYGADVPPARAVVRAQWVDSVHDAARRIAAAASSEGDITIQEARVNPLTWIRVARKHGIDAMLVTPDALTRKGDPRWLVATTPH
jgi:hypothetical protein